eukprot:CAMPEP_0177690858 /NCGR_PEP_ID=MMETSP0484_2-20121128/993_1 /TAXON_ID=354590 /ORGANISM="Rhodomonas lens, Strain RHODO" /LENGTH=519 /DNA_ID=CAMNT_0019201435 /DNA_START=134 /DNA_END=1690 /DNA_ORIENTATION=+
MSGAANRQYWSDNSVEWFLGRADKENIAQWRGIDHTERSERTITTRALNPFWEWAASLIPPTVAPNVLTLAGFTCTLQAYYLAYFYMDTNVTLCTMALIFCYMTLDAVDGKHAVKTRNASPLGELFNQACDNVGCIFLVLTLTSVLGITNLQTTWYLVQCVQLFFMHSHMRAWLKEKGQLEYGIFNGPGEALAIMLIILGVRAMFGLDWMYSTYLYLMKGYVIPHVVNHIVHTRVWDEGDPGAIAEETVRWMYYFFSGLCLLKVWKLGKQRSRFSLLICICYRMIPAILMWLAGARNSEQQATDVHSVICDGLFLSVLTTDVIVAKMAKRRIHPWVVLMCMLSVFNNFIILVLVLFYYTCLFAELSLYLNLPILTLNTNVYCDGVFDLCHKGHKNLFQAALAFGNRLHVGVMSDEDCAQYKRVPIMTTEERCREVDSCKAVYKAIHLADDYSKTGLTREFIDEHCIHIVCHGAEYDVKNPKFAERLANGETDYYKVPREMGITRMFPRTDGISTSELIK